MPIYPKVLESDHRESVEYVGIQEKSVPNPCIKEIKRRLNWDAILVTNIIIKAIEIFS